MRTHIQLSILLMLACGLPRPGMAACSRVINVPMAATGLSVIVDRDTITGGVHPEVLQSVQAKGECTFAMQLVPRARVELMLQDGHADLIIPATRTTARDAVGTFVPLNNYRAALISASGPRPLITSVTELLEQSALKVVLVRGFNYGPAYDELVQKLAQQGRVSYEPEPLAVARMLNLDSNWLTIMTPSILVGAIRNDARYADLLRKLKYEFIKELPWADSGAYVSKKSLSGADQKQLKSLLENAARSGLLWKSFQKHYGPSVLNVGIRPLSVERD